MGGGVCVCVCYFQGVGPRESTQGEGGTREGREYFIGKSLEERIEQFISVINAFSILPLGIFG